LGSHFSLLATKRASTTAREMQLNAMQKAQ
jgi:hypothetical protein